MTAQLTENCDGVFLISQKKALNNKVVAQGQGNAEGRENTLNGSSRIFNNIAKEQMKQV